MMRIEATAITRQFSVRGIPWEIQRAEGGSVWITSTFGVVTRASEHAPWHWSIIRSSGTQAGEGMLNTRKDMDAFAACLSTAPREGDEPMRHGIAQ